jgi:hypothetical protein
MKQSAGIGRLIWNIHDIELDRFVIEGNSVIQVQDIEIYVLPPQDAKANPFDSKPNVPITRKFCPLNDLFSFGIAHALSPHTDLPSDTELTGFALLSGHAREDVASWGWFDIDGPGHAIKRQETGELAIEVAEIGGSWDIIRTELLSDISIRLIPFGLAGVKLEGMSINLKPSWRLNIAKGSVIHWPSLVNGQPTLNGLL